MLFLIYVIYFQNYIEAVNLIKYNQGKPYWYDSLKNYLGEHKHISTFDTNHNNFQFLPFVIN